MQMDQETDSLPSIIAFHGDICVFGRTPEEHDEHLLHLMESAKTHGIVFNSAKCHIRQPQIAFDHAVFTGQGMQPDPPISKPYKTFLPQTCRLSYSPS